jgi:prepilin-type N-terminal cleavage/methylation domain-containing protein
MLKTSQAVRRQRRRISDSQGFTLFELIIVLAILSTLAALVAPRITKLPQRITPAIVDFLEAERANTVKTGKSTEIRLNGRSLLSEATGAGIDLGDDASLEVVYPRPNPYLPSTKLTAFYADGTMSATLFRVTSGDAAYTVEISPFFSRIRYANVD